MPRILRAAVIGLGAMGANHARVYAEMPDVELAGLADVDGERLRAVSRERGVAGYTDYCRMLARSSASTWSPSPCRRARMPRSPRV